jgi:hypothetical protein
MEALSAASVAAVSRSRRSDRSVAIRTPGSTGANRKLSAPPESPRSRSSSLVNAAEIWTTRVSGNSCLMIRQTSKPSMSGR